MKPIKEQTIMESMFYRNQIEPAKITTGRPWVINIEATFDNSVDKYYRTPEDQASHDHERRKKLVFEKRNRNK